MQFLPKEDFVKKTEFYNFSKWVFSLSPAGIWSRLSSSLPCEDMNGPLEIQWKAWWVPGHLASHWSPHLLSLPTQCSQWPVNHQPGSSVSGLRSHAFWSRRLWVVFCPVLFSLFWFFGSLVRATEIILCSHFQTLLKTIRLFVFFSQFNHLFTYF